MYQRPGTPVILTLIFVVVFGFAPTRARADEVIDWNQTMLRAGLMANVLAPNMTRVAALVQASMFDAVNGIDKRYTHIRVPPSGSGGASRRAAAVQAAYVVLSNLFGLRLVLPPASPSALQLTLQAMLDGQRTVSMLDIATEESPAAINSGIAWGESVATQMWNWRAGDGFGAGPFPPFPDNLTIGRWRRTPNLPASTTISPPGLGYIQLSEQMPWTMDTPFQFRPGPAPDLTSAAYARDFNETKAMGRFDSAFRTPDQTTAVYFWNGATASYVWNRAAVSLIEDRDGDRDDDHHDAHHRPRRHRLVEHARLLAAMGLAMADATIGCWDAKYADAFWRPVTAIRDMNDDGNPLTQSDAGWMPLLVTPGHPESPSGHSCISAAAGAVLKAEFGNRTRFSVDSDQMLGVTRSFRSLTEALEEVKNARIFGGIHFRAACDVGQRLGESVARHVLETKFQRLH